MECAVPGSDLQMRDRGVPLSRLESRLCQSDVVESDKGKVPA